MRTILLSDTTLRDGEQMPGAALDAGAKVAIAAKLAEAGVMQIEAGFPAAGPHEIEAVRRVVKTVRGPVFSALARTTESDIDAAHQALESVIQPKRVINLFIGASPLHRDHKLRKTQSGIIAIATRAIEYAKRSFGFVSFSPEDASRTEPDFLVALYREAIAAGANVIGFPDTVGILTPESVRSMVGMILSKVGLVSGTRLAVHFHNDLGLATANTLAGLQEGAGIAQCTVNGIGERAGNAALEEVAVALALNSEQYGCVTRIRLDQLTSLSRLVAERTGIVLPANKPVSGANVFATGAGIHQDGILKHPGTYLPFDPALVGGDPVRLILGRHSGRAGVKSELARLGVDDSEESVDRVLRTLKSEPKRARDRESDGWRDEQLRTAAEGEQ